MSLSLVPKKKAVTCLTTKKIDASGFNYVGGDVAEAHVKGSADVRFFHFTNLILRVRL